MNRLISLQCLTLSILSFFACAHHYPTLRPIFFAPYLIANFYRFPKQKLLLQALGLGLFCDISSSYLFGIHALLYVITTSILYNLHKLFLRDKWISVPIMTSLFSLTFSYLSYPALAFFNHKIIWNLSSLVLDIKQAFTVDFLYCGLIYFLPCTITQGIFKMRSYFRSRSCY